MRSVVILLLAVACSSPSPSSPPASTPPPTSTPVKDDLARGRDRATALVAALRASDAAAIAALADPQVGLTVWSTPGVYPRPAGTLTRAAPQLPPDPYPGYYKELADVLEAGAAVLTLDAAPYVVPPEEELAAAPPWATLRTRGVDLLVHVPDPEDQPLARSHPVRYELHAERGYQSVHVYFSERKGTWFVTDVMMWTHYDA